MTGTGGLVTDSQQSVLTASDILLEDGLAASGKQTSEHLAAILPEEEPVLGKLKLSRCLIIRSFGYITLW